MKGYEELRTMAAPDLWEKISRRLEQPIPVERRVPDVGSGVHGSRWQPPVRWLLACTLMLGAIAGLVLLGLGGSNTPQPEGTEVLGPRNWLAPVPGMNVPSVPVAQRLVPFRITQSRYLGAPWRIIVSPKHAAIKDRFVVLVYKNPRYGIVDVYEEAPQVSQSQFRRVIQQWVRLNGKPGTVGTTTAVTLHRSYPALMTTSADGRTSDIRWIETGVEYMIRGPSLTKRDCIGLANRLASEVAQEHGQP